MKAAGVYTGKAENVQLVQIFLIWKIFFFPAGTACQCENLGVLHTHFLVYSVIPENKLIG